MEVGHWAIHTWAGVDHTGSVVGEVLKALRLFKLEIFSVRWTFMSSLGDCCSLRTVDEEY